MRVVCEALGFGEGDHFGGSARVAALNARGLAARGHHVTFLCTNLKDKHSKLHPGFHRTTLDGVEVIYLKTITAPFWPGDFGPHHVRIPGDVRELVHRADVVHLNEFRSFLSARVGLEAMAHGVPVVMQPQGTFLRHDSSVSIKRVYDLLWGRRIAGRAARFIAATSVEAGQLAQGGIDAIRIRVVPNGIDVARVGPMPERGEFRRKMAVPPDAVICVSVGRLDALKGFDLMVRAMLHLPAHVRYVVVGPDQQGLSESLRSLARDLGVADRVTLTGPLPRARDVLAAVVDADVLVVPSRYECFGQVILEGALAGRPMVLSSGCNLAGEFGERGALVASPEPKAIAAACARLIEDRELRDRLGAEGRRMALERYTLESVAAQLERVYAEIVGPGRP